MKFDWKRVPDCLFPSGEKFPHADTDIRKSGRTTQMVLFADRFYVGDMPAFLGLVKLLKADPDFMLRFDFPRQCLELESIMMAGIVAVGSRLFQGSGGIFVVSPQSRTDECLLRVDSQAFSKAISTLNQVSYAYLSLQPGEEATLCIDAYTEENVCIGSAVLNTLAFDDDHKNFTVINQAHDDLPYSIIAENLGGTWARFLQSASIETTLHYDPRLQQLQWVTHDQHTRMSLHLPISPQPATSEVQICLNPSVVTILRTVLQVTQKHSTTLAYSEDLPICLSASLDAQGSFIRIYAGTKDD